MAFVLEGVFGAPRVRSYEAAYEQFGTARPIRGSHVIFRLGRAMHLKRVGRHIESGLMPENVATEVKIERGELRKMEEGVSLTRLRPDFGFNLTGGAAAGVEASEWSGPKSCGFESHGSAAAY